jgi:hypothetical protein
METLILVVWWIGLIGALLATLVILKEVAVLVKALRDILQLAELTRDAARGLVRNVQAGERLAEVAAPARNLHTATRALALHAGAVAQKLSAFARLER